MQTLGVGIAGGATLAGGAAAAPYLIRGGAFLGNTTLQIAQNAISPSVAPRLVLSALSLTADTFLGSAPVEAVLEAQTAIETFAAIEAAGAVQASIEVTGAKFFLE